MDRRAVQRWVEGYERLWRTPDTDHLAELFHEEATYLPSPWGRPLVGLDEIALFWEAERDGPDDEFAMSSEVIAVDGDTAAVRVEVEYGGSEPSRWRDLWVLQFAPDGRCAAFEEWPFAPDQPDGH